jgi:23S rRNA (pseudouridine1915-N3)-methyltransferase
MRARIKILAVGDLKEEYFKSAEFCYVQNLRKTGSVEIIEMKSEKAPKNLSVAACQSIREQEGEKLLRRVEPDDTVIALDAAGQTDWKIIFQRLRTAGTVAFLIGGSLGLGQNALRRADYTCAFSRMTYPHRLARLILLEILCQSIGRS